MKRASEQVKARLKMLDAMGGYAGLVGPLTLPEDRELLRRGWVRTDSMRPHVHHISRKGRAALKRYAGYRCAFG